MDTELGHGYLCVRDIDADGLPVVGVNWNVHACGGWSVVHRNDGGVLLAAWRANAIATRALYALFGPQDVLEAIAATEPACMPAREAWARRAEPAVRAWLRRWPAWRFDGAIRVSGAMVSVSGASRRLIFEGQQVPDPTVTPFPWRFAADGSIVATEAAAVVRVDSIARPAMVATLAGYLLHDVAENQPPR